MIGIPQFQLQSRFK